MPGLLPIGLALLMAGLLLWLMGVDPLAYYGFILLKGLLAPSRWQASLTRMGPLLLIAASPMVAFSAGLWNLGGGQFMLGAVLASAIPPALLSHGVPLGITLLLALLAGAPAGMLWGFLPAALKIWRNINEIITSLMMSFLGVSLANVLVKLLVADPATTVPQTRNLPWEQRLPMLFGGQVSSLLLLGLLAVLLTHAVINHTAFGLSIRVMGANPRAAIHAELSVCALTLAVFALSAGLAGVVEIIGIQGNVRADWNPAYSLIVGPLVFLAQFNGFGSIALVFVFSVLSIGSESAARRGGWGRPQPFHLVDRSAAVDRAGIDPSWRSPGCGRRCAIARCVIPLKAALSVDEGEYMEGLTSDFVTSLLMEAIVAGIPLLLAGLGEQLSEKAGVLNIDLEGMMLAGAWLGFLVA